MSSDCCVGCTREKMPAAINGDERGEETECGCYFPELISLLSRRAWRTNDKGDEYVSAKEIALPFPFPPSSALMLALHTCTWR